MYDEAVAATTRASASLRRGPIWPLAAIVLLCLLAWLPGLIMLPPLDRDESRFAEASRQMLETGNFVDIRFANGPRYNKPIGIYWLQAVSASLRGPAMRGRIWVYRLPSFVGGLSTLMLLYRLARGIAPPRTALLASLLLGATLILTVESDIATTDAALLAAIVAAQAAAMHAYLAARQEWRPRPSLAMMLAGWAAIGAGVLLKGPVILAVLGATVLALSLWDRDWKWLAGTRPLIGAGMAFFLVAPWAIAIGLATHGGFFQQSLGHDFAAKILGAEETHGASPGYFLVLASFTFWPATLFLIPAVALAIARRGDPACRYLLCWSSAVWLIFELVPTKLPHYILPAYPPLALLAAFWVTQAPVGAERGWTRLLQYIAAAQFALVAAAFAALCALLPGRLGGTSSWPLFFGAGVGVAVACAAIVQLLNRRREWAAVLAVVSATVFYLLLAFGVVPQLRALWLSPRAAELVAANRRATDAGVELAGYVEPSLVFLLGSETRIVTGGAAAARRGLVLVESGSASSFAAGLKRSEATATPLGTVSGLDYSRGRTQSITLYRVAPTLRHAPGR